MPPTDAEIALAVQDMLSEQKAAGTRRADAPLRSGLGVHGRAAVVAEAAERVRGEGGGAGGGDGGGGDRGYDLPFWLRLGLGLGVLLGLL